MGESISETRGTNSAKKPQKLPLLQVKGKDIVDGRGKKVVLKGIVISNNVWGNWIEENGYSQKLKDQGKFWLKAPTEQDQWVLTDKDFTQIKKLGATVVRYQLNFDLFSKDNPNRNNNLLRLKSHIEKFNALGIYVIVNLHFAEGLNCANDAVEGLKPGKDRVQSIFENQTYWKNTVEIWKFLAESLKGLPGIAGYEIFNEPRLPSDADCLGERKTGCATAEFTTKYDEIIAAIRKIDPRHILFISGYESREANPGETYWAEVKKSQWAQKVDQGEQGILWEPGFVKVKAPNIAGVIHFYKPGDYVFYGKGDSFDKEEIKKHMQDQIRSMQATMGNIPIAVTEYGVNGNQSPENRTKWLNFVHNKLFRNHGIAVSAFFDYKSLVGPYLEHGDISYLHSLVGYYKYREQEIEIKNNECVFKNLADDKMAKENGFNLICNKYFLSSKEAIIAPEVWVNLQNYFLAPK